MIYTVGHEKKYDKLLHDTLGHSFKKLGRNGTYPGGFAVATVDDATRLIEEWGKVGEWAIYEVDADWEKDTKPSLQGWWHALQRDALITRKVVVKRTELVVRHEVAEDMQRLLQAPSKTYGKELAYDMEVVFDDGMRMAIQVCPGSYDPTVLDGVEGEEHWTQAVLFTEEGDEMACSEPGDTFLGKHVVEATRVGEKVLLRYECVVRQETPYPEAWTVTGEVMHNLVIVAPMDQSKHVLDWVYDRGGRTTRSGPASTGNPSQADGKLYEAHAVIPVGSVDIKYQKLACLVCGCEFIRPEGPDSGGFAKATGQGVCSRSCRRTLAESGIV